MRARVCMLTSVHQPFDGRIYHRESRSLAQAGYGVTLVAPADFNSQTQHGIVILGFPKPLNRLQRPIVWWRIARLVPRLEPDVIHFHDPELLLLVPFFRAVLGSKVKLVYDVHEYFVDDVASKYWIPSWLKPVATRLSGRFERRLVAEVDGIICAVEGQRRSYADQAAALTVVRNLPVARVFEGATPHPKLNSVGTKLIYVGLILPERGIDVLLQAVSILVGQGRDVRLYLVGRETSRAYMEEIRAFAGRNKLTDRILWLGYVPHDEIKHYLRNADIGVAPGLRTRQYKNPSISTKLFEYMICGLPIVSVDHPHRKRYIDECQCGITVPPLDPYAWAEAISRLVDHPHEAQAMGQRGQTMVLDRYTWEEEQRQLLSFYDRLLGSQDPSEPVSHTSK